MTNTQQTEQAQQTGADERTLQTIMDMIEAERNALDDLDGLRVLIWVLRETEREGKLTLLAADKQRLRAQIAGLRLRADTGYDRYIQMVSRRLAFCEGDGGTESALRYDLYRSLVG